MSTEAWLESRKDFDAYRRVGSDRTPGGFWVSTVWLGLDHSHGEGPPLIFETMVFAPGGRDVELHRYATEAEARAGHAEVLARWRDVPADWKGSDAD